MTGGHYGRPFFVGALSPRVLLRRHTAPDVTLGWLHKCLAELIQD